MKFKFRNHKYIALRQVFFISDSLKCFLSKDYLNNSIQVHKEITFVYLKLCVCMYIYAQQLIYIIIFISSTTKRKTYSSW